VTGFDDLRREDSWMGTLKGATDAASRNFLLFRFGDRARLALRPSGTEPKAKAYVEVCSAPCPPRATAQEWERTRRETDELARRLADEFLRAALGTIGLTPPAKG
jgi:phosphoglucomutase/phosphomannomutase